MPIYPTADGGWSVQVCVKRRRLHRRLEAGTAKSEARRVEAELIRALHQQPAESKPAIPGDPLLTALLADYAERHVRTLRSPETARYHALRIGQWCIGRRASEARQVAQAIQQDLAEGYAQGTINRSLSALKKALRDAWRRGEVAADYSAHVELQPERNARTTWLTMAQVQTIAEHASAPVRAAIWISLFTGCRRGEVLALRPTMISREAITLPAGATKTLRTREGLKSGFRRAREAAGMPHVTFHDLRRSCGTLLVQHGVSLQVVSRILGHSSTTVTERVYAHLQVKQLREGLGVLTDLHRDLHRRRRKAA